MMETGSLASWVEVAVAIVVIVGGQIVLWTKFRAKVDGKFQSYDEHLAQHDKCLAQVKNDAKGYLTMPQHDKIQDGCRAEIFARIASASGDIGDMKNEFRGLREEIKGLDRKISQLLALKTGEIQ